MKIIYPAEIQKENDKLVEMYINMDENLSIEDFVEKNASVKFKKYMKELEEEENKMLAEGCMS